MSVLSFDKIMYHPEHIIAAKDETKIFPVHATISLSNHCNHKCLWCTAYEFQQDKAILTDYNKLLAFLTKAKKRGLKAITYVGNGEPTIYPKFLDLIKAVNELGLEQSMFTNGHILDKFEKEILEYFTWIRISLDAGSTEIHNKMHDVENHFDKIISNIKSIVKNKSKGFMIGVQYAVHHQNIDDMHKSAKIASEIGVDYFSIKPVFSRGGVGTNIEANNLTHLTLDPVCEIITKDLQTEKFKIFYRPYQVLSHEQGKTTHSYLKCVAGFFNINIYEKGEIIFCAPHKIEVGTLDDDLEDIEGRIVELSNNLNLNNCPAGCRYHELNDLIHNISHPLNDSRIKHINFI